MDVYIKGVPELWDIHGAVLTICVGDKHSYSFYRGEFSAGGHTKLGHGVAPTERRDRRLPLGHDPGGGRRAAQCRHIRVRLQGPQSGRGDRPSRGASLRNQPR
jgi:hypothetical protein